MENKNLEGFKPLSQEEEKHVVGGNPTSPAMCAQIEQQIDVLQNQEKMMEKQGLPVPPMMRQEIADLTEAYQLCVSKEQHP